MTAVSSPFRFSNHGGGQRTMPALPGLPPGTEMAPRQERSAESARLERASRGIRLRNWSGGWRTGFGCVRRGADGSRG